MKTSISLWLMAVTAAMMLSACSTSAPRYDYNELAHASIVLDMEIDMKDNHGLYMEAAEWLGVPYRPNGNSKQGIDCSGLTSQIYKKVYGRELERSAEDQRTKDCHKVHKGRLREGDLVFFHNGSKSKMASHVGIYLKDRKFIHSSAKRGVVISSLDNEYYSRHWLCGGRP